MGKKFTIQRGVFIEAIIGATIIGAICGNWITNSIVSDAMDNCNEVIMTNESLKYYIFETLEKGYK